MSFPYSFKFYQLRVFSSWFTNLSAGFLGSIFFLISERVLLTFSVLLSILFLYLSIIIEKYLDNP